MSYVTNITVFYFKTISFTMTFIKYKGDFILTTLASLFGDPRSITMLFTVISNEGLFLLGKRLKENIFQELLIFTMGFTLQMKLKNI